MSRRLAWLALFGLAAVSIALVVTPAWLIQPFRPQTPGEVALSWRLRDLSPVATVVLWLAMVALAVRLWRGARWIGRTVLVLLVALAAGPVWLARQNHFEWMFAPLEGPRFAPVDDAGFLGQRDVVLAVTLRGESAAYPLRQMAYHHVVADVVGGVPIVVTY